MCRRINRRPETDARRRGGEEEQKKEEEKEAIGRTGETWPETERNGREWEGVAWDGAAHGSRQHFKDVPYSVSINRLGPSIALQCLSARAPEILRSIAFSLRSASHIARGLFSPLSYLAALLPRLRAEAYRYRYCNRYCNQRRRNCQERCIHSSIRTADADYFLQPLCLPPPTVPEHQSGCPLGEAKLD